MQSPPESIYTWFLDVVLVDRRGLESLHGNPDRCERREPLETESEPVAVTEFTRSRRSSRTPDSGRRTGSDTVTVTATDTGWMEPVTGLPAVPFSEDSIAHRPRTCSSFS